MITAVGSQKKIERKYLVTVAEWEDTAGATYVTTAAPSSKSAYLEDKAYLNLYKFDETKGSLVRGTEADANNFAKYTYKLQSSDPSVKSAYREVLGVRTEDSSIELNPDTQTSTDILGHTYTDVNKTEPQQSFDPFFITGDSYLGDYLAKAMMENNINAYNNNFTIYIVALYDGMTPATMDEIRDGTYDGPFNAVRHEKCTILPTSIGGDSFISMPIEVHYSNILTPGTVSGLKNMDAFEFVPNQSVKS